MVWKVLGPCLIVQLSMSPLIAFHFLMFSPIGVIMNPPSVALVGLLLPIGLLMFFTSLFIASELFPFQQMDILFNILFSGLSNIAEFLCTLLLQLSRVGTQIGKAGRVIAPPLGLLLIFYLLYFLFFSETRFISLRRRKRKLFLAFLSGLLILLCLAPKYLGVTSSVLPWKYDTALVTFLDVGQGDSIHVNAGNINVLIDGGGHYYRNIGKDVLTPYLLKNGIDHIDLAIVTHSDSDHRKGMEEVSSDIPISRLMVSSPYKEDPRVYSDIMCSDLVYASAGMKITLDDDVSLSVLAPSSSAALLPSSNENSLVIMLSYRGLDVLLTGDIGIESEAT
ncbi:MAG: ComEC/Rec2 family competence protein, partial [Clostridia bacterium]|nr:ComEC/Rec2 family competence protein [Clostridia bacterium]